MTSQSTTKGVLSSVLILILFIVGCIFLYWAVEYWVYHNSDKGRYEIIKIEGANGADTGSFWKLDRRAGIVQYCSLNNVVRNNANVQELHCIPAMTEEDRRKEAQLRKSTAPAESVETVTTTTSTVQETPPAVVTPPAPPPPAPPAAQ
jgi:hypothetical protein